MFQKATACDTNVEKYSIEFQVSARAVLFFFINDGNTHKNQLLKI